MKKSTVMWILMVLVAIWIVVLPKIADEQRKNAILDDQRKVAILDKLVAAEKKAGIFLVGEGERLALAAYKRIIY